MWSRYLSLIFTSYCCSVWIHSSAAPLVQRDWWYSHLCWRLNECLLSFKGHTVWLQENTVNRGWGAEEEEDAVVVQWCACQCVCVHVCVRGGGGVVVKRSGRSVNLGLLANHNHPSAFKVKPKTAQIIFPRRSEIVHYMGWRRLEVWGRRERIRTLLWTMPWNRESEQTQFKFCICKSLNLKIILAFFYFSHNQTKCLLANNVL